MEKLLGKGLAPVLKICTSTQESSTFSGFLATALGQAYLDLGSLRHRLADPRSMRSSKISHELTQLVGSRAALHFYQSICTQWEKPAKGEGPGIG